ncbi:hypothetical protein ScPMuIL_000363 [Solemya velum]
MTTYHSYTGKPRMAVFKLVLLGELGVGKTSIFFHAKGDPFVDKKEPSLRIESCSKVVSVNGEKVTLTLWDTVGVERFRTLTRNYYRNSHGVLLVYSVDNPASLRQLSRWSQDADEFAPTALKFVIGTKADRENVIASERVANFGSVHRCENAFLLSSKTVLGTRHDVLLFLTWCQSKNRKMDKLSPPPQLNLTGNLAENWRRFKQQYEIYEAASGTDQRDERVRSMTFLHVVGSESLEIYNTFSWDEDGDKFKLTAICEKFEDYCNPRKNVTFERHVFFTRNQREGEHGGPKIEVDETRPPAVQPPRRIPHTLKAK